MMSMMQDTVEVRVPATTANLGSGFDTVGLALDFHDSLSFTLGESDDDAVSVDIEGEGAETLPRDASHLVITSFRRAAADLGLPLRKLHLSAHNRIPQARGMGSSAEAIVAGIAAAYAFANDGVIDRDDVFAAAAAIEGHPDNVAPAVYGGLTFSWKLGDEAGDGDARVITAQQVHRESASEPRTVPAHALPAGYHTVRYPVSADIHAYVFVPDFALSTSEARNALPQQIPYQDAIYNVSRVGLLPAAMCPASFGGQAGGTGDRASASNPAAGIQGSGLNGNELLFCATQDALHQGYRAPLMRQSSQLLGTLRAEGFAATISGAGPCVLVLRYGDIEQRLRALAGPQLDSGHWRLLPLAIDLAGVQVERRQ